MNEEGGVPVEVVAPKPMANQEWSDRWADFQTFVADQLVPDVDFGRIPGVNKPSLWKAGAEKVCARYLCRPHIVAEEKVEDWDKGLFCFDTTVELRRIDNDIVMGEGVGSCNSYEEKFRYTWLSKAKLGGRTDFVESRKKKGRYGEYEEYKVERKDLASIRNTVQKMAFKRAFVAAALTLSCASQIFTQDVEDFENGEIVKPKSAPNKISKLGGRSNKSSSKKTGTPANNNASASTSLSLPDNHDIAEGLVKNLTETWARTSDIQHRQVLDQVGVANEMEIKSHKQAGAIYNLLEDLLEGRK